MQTFPNIRQLLDIADDKSSSRYNPFVHQPDTCNALSSSLWELVLLESHYHPTVSEKSSATAEGSGTQLIPLEVLKQFDTSLGGFNPAITKPTPHSFEGVIKNAPNSKCYLTSKSTIEEQLADLSQEEEEGAHEDAHLFAKFFQEEKHFNAQFEEERLKQKLESYKALLARYLEYEG